MATRECYHCKQLVEDDGTHDCWTTTEGALTRDLPEDLRDAWDRLRETAADFGGQRIYASHNSIMFSRKACYFFVRPKKKFLEVCLFLGQALKSPRIRRVDATSKTKFAHIIQITHRDEVEPPFTDWLRAAYDFSAGGAAVRTAPSGRRTPPAPKAAAKKKQQTTRTKSQGRAARKAPLAPSRRRRG